MAIIALMYHLLFALLGLLTGGLINVLADDLPQRVRPQPPRCIQCRYSYSPRRWLGLGRRLQGGRCPTCALPVRRRELVVELGTALLFALLPFFLETPGDLLLGALYVALLILIIVTDLEHRLIFHVVTLPGLLLALVGSVFSSYNDPLLALLGAAVGFVFFFVLYLVGGRLFGPGALGFGDVTLSTLIGAMTGFPLVLLALILGILLAGLTTLLLLLSRRLSMRSTIAYGPFLAAAAIVAVIWGEEILRWYF